MNVKILMNCLVYTFFDYSQSLHESINALQDNVAKLKIVEGVDWFNKLFGDWGNH